MDPNREETAALHATIQDLQERLEVVVGLEDRLRIAESRALDAERRLQELTEQIDGPRRRRANVQIPDSVDPGSSSAVTLPDVPPEVADLRTRLARTASRKKAGGGAGG